MSALVNMLDKTVMHRYARSSLTLPLLVGVAQTLVGIVVLAFVRIPDSSTLESTATALLSGLLFGVAGNLMMRVLYSQEVSRTVPVTQTAPIFAALIGVAFLGESVTMLQWLAIVATVVGAVTISLRFGTNYRGVLLHRSFFVLLLSALIMAAANVIGKVALDDLPVLYTHALRSLGLGGVFLAVNVRREPIRNIAEFLRGRSPALVFVALNEMIVANTALILLLWALSLGPVSLVIALMASRSMFVVIYSSVLAFIWKGALGEQTTRVAVAVKIGSTALIIGGVAGIAV
jgi:drug/metabolite transporter (DMT)-like permease